MKWLPGALCACALLLTACGGPAVPAEPPAPLTEAEVLAAYDDAAQVYGWFDLAPLPTAGDAVEADGGVYRPVDYDGLSTYADLEARVRGCFAPALADLILTESVSYRDIGGKLHCAGGGRGENLYLLNRTVTAEQVDKGHWTVTLTFWADSYEWERPEVTVGYSQKTLDYERTADGWRFTSFCPGDALDLDSETVFAFTYDPETFETTDFDSYTDLRLACYLLHADGAYSEGPGDDLMHRFLERPEDILALRDQLHPDWQARIFDGIGHNAAAWLDREGLAAFASVLSSCEPEGPGAQAALDRVKAAFDEGCRRAEEDLNYQLFSLVIGDKVLHLGKHEGAFPWGCDLTEVPRETGGGDGFGTVYTVDCGTLTLRYGADAGDGEYLYSMKTEDPGVKTFLGIGVGSSEADILAAYPSAVFADTVWAVDGADPWEGGAWVYHSGGDDPAIGKWLTFYMKDGKVAAIQIEHIVC